MMNEFKKYGVKALPFVGDVLFLVKTKTRVKINDHLSLLEFDWAKPGEERALGKTVMNRWSQLSNNQMGVEVKLSGKTNDATDDGIEEYGDISVVPGGLCLMGSPIGTGDYRSRMLIEFAETKFKDFYNL